MMNGYNIISLFTAESLFSKESYLVINRSLKIETPTALSVKDRWFYWLGIQVMKPIRYDFDAVNILRFISKESYHLVLRLKYDPDKNEPRRIRAAGITCGDKVFMPLEEDFYDSVS